LHIGPHVVMNVALSCGAPKLGARGEFQ